MSCQIYSDKMSPMRKETLNMTQEEIEKLRVINQTIDRLITIKTAAEMLGLSERANVSKSFGFLRIFAR